ncbi:flagellar hook-length control protein FliK [uncultured Clostridium sp.]|uniref:flagellar hook-length control protein FliK n=1 Tax=uncultured Clostridium sp. TaxID=59620 RepID=UPI0025FA35F2|nr:flagellar hook-length control protein FliK [uncultured Clostridium sp.]
MEINMLQALSNFKTNSVEVKGNGTEGDFLKSLNNLINSEEFNGEENIEAENIIVNEEVKSDKNIEIKDVIQSYEKDELIEFVEDNKEDDLNKIDENLIILANRIFNNISYKEKQQFDITEDNADFKNNTQMDMNIVNNNVNKQQEIVDNLIAFVESSSNKDNIQNKIDFIKKTFDFNEVKSKLTDLVESNFNLQNSKDEFTNNVEKGLDFASELEAISNFKVLSMKDNIKVNDSKNEINFLNNIAMTNNNANLEVKTENLEPHVVRSEYIANDIVESINYLKVNNLEEIKVKMNPKDLGELHIKIIKENNVEKVFITLHNSESFKLVKDNVAEIKNHLNNLDINVNEVNVEMKSENRDDFSQNLNQQFNKGNNKQQRRAVKFEIENESSIENDLLKTDSNINRLI